MKILGFAGYSGAGKTTLIEQLIPRFRQQSLRVSLIKHAHDDFEIDKPGKDSFRHRAAGACEVMLVSARRWALVHELHDEDEPALAEQILRMSPCDLLLVEGYKHSLIPKIEIYRSSLGRPPFREKSMNIVARASDTKNHFKNSTRLPQLDLNNPDEVARFVLDFLQIQSRPSAISGAAPPIARRRSQPPLIKAAAPP